MTEKIPGIQLSRSYNTQQTSGMPFGRMSEKDWQTMVDQLVTSKQIPNPLPIDKLFTNAFVPN